MQRKSRGRAAVPERCFMDSWKLDDVSSYERHQHSPIDSGYQDTRYNNRKQGMMRADTIDLEGGSCGHSPWVQCEHAGATFTAATLNSAHSKVQLNARDCKLQQVRCRLVEPIPTCL